MNRPNGPFRRIHSIRTVFKIAFLILASCAEKAPAEERFPDIRSISCLMNEKGCPCYEKPDAESARMFLLNHAEAAHAVEGPVSGFQKIRVRSSSCYMEEKRLTVKEYDRADHSGFKEMKHELLGLDRLLDEKTERDPGNFRHEFIGYFWPTFYHLAMEDLHPGPLTDIVTPKGEVIGRASKSFLRWVVWEGSGITKDGMKIRYAFQPNRFEKYDQKQWGEGAGYGYHIYPYRTVAVNYPGLCRRLKKWIPDCSRSRAIGTMLYIREIAERNVVVNGVHHDGYICATDTGAPYYIREDRMDLFVGTHGGGNPYLPSKLQPNRYIEGGIINIIPSDWGLWRKEKDRVWCPYEKIPEDPFHPKSGECTHDYHARASKKALHVSVVLDQKGRPVKCRKKVPL